jgi:hypothetical protein
MAPIALKNPFREEGSEGIAEEIFDNADLVWKTNKQLFPPSLTAWQKTSLFWKEQVIF